MALSQIERVRLDKAAVDEGFGLKRNDQGDWLAYDSLGAPASIRLTCVAEGYVAAVNHGGVPGSYVRAILNHGRGAKPTPNVSTSTMVYSLLRTSTPRLMRDSSPLPMRGKFYCQPNSGRRTELR